MEYSNQNFFDETSKFYNSMINSMPAIDRREKLFSKLKIKNSVVADLGCGSGIDSIALSKCGNSVDSFDSSVKMIELAKKSVAEEEYNIDFHNFAIEKIPDLFDKKFSFVCSLGNTIANIEPQNLTLAFQKIKEILQPNGIALIHILNYDLILSKKGRILNITANEETQFIRFYDFYESHLVFNILKFNKNNPKEHKLISTNLFPHSFENISQYLILSTLAIWNFTAVLILRSLILRSLMI